MNNTIFEFFKKELEEIEKILENTYKEPNNLQESLNKLNKHEDVLMYPHLKWAIREHIIKVFKDSQIKEYDLYKWFADNFYLLFSNHFKNIPRGKINNQKHQADAWVKYNNTYIPIEMKLNNFDNSALLQLNRYLDFYKCKYGIAIAKELTCKLPSNIIFINYKDIVNKKYPIKSLEVFNNE